MQGPHEDLLLGFFVLCGVVSGVAIGAALILFGRWGKNKLREIFDARSR